jgi:hypothetical protein
LLLTISANKENSPVTGMHRSIGYVLLTCPISFFKKSLNKNMGDGIPMINEKYGLKSMVTDA